VKYNSLLGIDMPAAVINTMITTTEHRTMLVIPRDY